MIMHRLAILVGVMRDANCDKIINLAFARNYMMYFWIRMYLYWGNRLNQEGQRLVSHFVAPRSLVDEAEGRSGE